MISNRKLPDDFLTRLHELEISYLGEKDPIRQSGFGGGDRRWRDEREPILDGVDHDGDFLDIGCANGYLLECLIDWGRERDLSITPVGIDWSDKLIALAGNRLPSYKENFFTANAWEWKPERTFPFVYTLYDCVPEDYLEEYIHRLLGRVVAPIGRLIVGAYVSRSDHIPFFDIAAFLKSIGFRVSGSSKGGDPPVAAFAWIDNRG